MSLKEELRNKARAVEAEEEQARAREEERQTIYREQLAPILREAAAYFREVVADLNVIKPDVRAVYHLGPPSSPEVEFTQQDYIFREDDHHAPTEVFVGCSCELSTDSFSRFVKGVEASNEFEAMLRDRGLTYRRKTHQNPVSYQTDGASFTIEGSLQAGFRIYADPEGGRIVITLQNLEDRPSRQYFLQPGRFDEGFLESLGRVMLREQDQLLRSEVSESARNRLQKEVEVSRERQEKELAEALAEAEAARRAEAESRLASRVVKGTRSALGRFRIFGGKSRPEE